jgi:hypothetical protein
VLNYSSASILTVNQSEKTVHPEDEDTMIVRNVGKDTYKKHDVNAETGDSNTADRTSNLGRKIKSCPTSQIAVFTTKLE